MSILVKIQSLSCISSTIDHYLGISKEYLFYTRFGKGISAGFSEEKNSYLSYRGRTLISYLKATGNPQL
jgi:hypothetical protein